MKRTLITLVAFISILTIGSSLEYKAEASIDPVWEYCKAEYNMDYDYYLDVFTETDEYEELYNALMKESH